MTLRGTSTALADWTAALNEKYQLRFESNTSLYIQVTQQIGELFIILSARRQSIVRGDPFKE